MPTNSSGNIQKNGYLWSFLAVASRENISGFHLINASVTTRRTCYGVCVSGAVAELRLKFCVFCGWLGSERDSAATVPATHVSCGRRASDAPNHRQKIPQRRHVQRTGAVPSRYLQRAFAVPPATCPHGGVRVCTSMARRRCVEGTTHVRCTHGHILPAHSIYSELITGIPEKIIFNLTKQSVNMAWYPRRLTLHLVAEGQRRNNLIMALMGRPLPSAPFWRPYPSFWVPSPRWADDNAWDYIF